MIIIKLQGGLGNQMFQYAFASILAKKNKTSVLIDRNSFEVTEKRHGYTPRNFELNVFNNSYGQATASDIITFDNLSIIDKLKKKLGLHYPKRYEEIAFNFQSETLSIKAPIYLTGYFQSYKYFTGFENYIKKKFSFPVDKLDEMNKKLLITIKNSNTISIHVRRGDYVSDTLTQQFHGNCSLEYYLEAIALLSSKSKDFILIFFSDDSQWVKEQFQNLPYSKIFIDQNKNENSWKDMFLMSSCNHNIIANSSFSWWAAWLNENPEKIVIAPKHWYVESEAEKHTMDLIPSAWIRL
ncbi:alpha-1,2-fucosyltransferase [Flavobacterium sp. LB2P84]|uniref:alpha-1,2-fucosyltransferase n=1 Tax=Flavobacterium yafengii TaxID=3041253 RepID=UPI0024A9550E|nr:alpha-1,2-fucosyltransferase [Flavobacterium yafengii]MDI6034176.1 alpha-1,2-fucosyltransferase [Flavobacterium yafengii]